jgi:hypothetical protein
MEELVDRGLAGPVRAADHGEAGAKDDVRVLGAAAHGEAATGAAADSEAATGPVRETLDLAALARELYGDGRVRHALAGDADPAPAPVPADLGESLQEARTLVLDRLRSTGA